jgi:hypothetical protein
MGCYRNVKGMLRTIEIKKLGIKELNNLTGNSESKIKNSLPFVVHPILK